MVKSETSTSWWVYKASWISSRYSDGQACRSGNQSKTKGKTQSCSQENNRLHKKCWILNAAKFVHTCLHSILLYASCKVGYTLVGGRLWPYYYTGLWASYLAGWIPSLMGKRQGKIDLGSPSDFPPVFIQENYLQVVKAL
ncbi:hypothetical protein AG1IA_09064 [Rhizoctonia solani AG-1 IA]|uniref:Uncharacterized protein n=1 Tax=Thanatephorus cucumeris (strain AG1-IA) TaxID=983506 RepID=L8WFF7_THACA|nr:hypothetical protein AG1IA_09064 [Rhizoctonia solani AG-1 IA]